MYDKHVPIIRAHALASPQGLTDLITFVLLTIQQQFPTVARQFADVRANGANSKVLFGSKRAGYQYACEHKEVIFAAVTKAVEVSDTIGAIDVLTNVPGLGIAKAAFVAQCVGLDVACLDQHNLARLGLPDNAFNFKKTIKPETRRAKIEAYVKLTRKSGGARYWWNTWCEYVAGRRNSPLKTGAAVSAFHCQALGLA